MTKNIEPRQEDITNHLLQQIANLTLENASLRSVINQSETADADESNE